MEAEAKGKGKGERVKKKENREQGGEGKRKRGMKEAEEGRLRSQGSLAAKHERNSSMSIRSRIQYLQSPPFPEDQMYGMANPLHPPSSTLYPIASFRYVACNTSQRIHPT